MFDSFRKIRENALVQYTVISFIITLSIALIMSYFLTHVTQEQMVSNHGNNYASFLSAISSNYHEILPEIISYSEGEDKERQDLAEVDTWHHFEKDLRQYPSINKFGIFNNEGTLIWALDGHDDFSMTEVESFLESGALEKDFLIINEKDHFKLQYFFPIKIEGDIIGFVEIVDDDSTLEKILDKARVQVVLVIMFGGLVFYVGLFLLFFKVYIKQKQAFERLGKSQNLTIFTMSRLAELKDGNTGAHILRTSRYCRLIGLALKQNRKYARYISKDYIEDLQRSAPLHDIGKVGIPDSILLKPGKLTDDEFDVIKTHPVLGANVLKSASEELDFQSFFEIGHQIVRSHHENWDGTGYPDKLEGEHIPLSARIMAVADVYDALTTERPYKIAFSHEDAVSFIKADAGKKFDPDVVDAFLQTAEAIKASLSVENSQTTHQFMNSPFSRKKEKAY